MPLVLVVDDVRALADQYAYDLERIGGFETRVVEGGQEAIDTILGTPVDCVILDLEMPGVDGFTVLRELEKAGIDTPVIVYTGTGNYARCVQAVQLGAFGFIDKSEPMEAVAHEVRRALRHAEMTEELDTLRKRAGGESSLVGGSAPMVALKEEIARVGPVPSAVLVVGESGTGKELVARELHRHYAADEKRAFIAVNCAALPENLVESELFGHERGAFTGAAKLHRGAFERAANGTIFLDEIGEMPLPVQAKLLRVLEARELTRVGGEKTVKVTARVVAATNRDLDHAVAEGVFRQDLLFRLNVHTISVPPLRDRRSDIAEISGMFVATVCRQFGVRRKRLAPEVLDVLMRHDWRRNNVRELRNAVERMVLASDSQVIALEHVPFEILPDESAEGHGDSQDQIAARSITSFRQRKREAERQIVVSALESNDWKITKTASDLGLADHASLLKIMRRLGIKGRG